MLCTFQFYFVLVATFLRAFVFKYVPYLYEKLYKCKSSPHVMKRKEVEDMVKELSQISMTDEWVKYAKLQRKINKSKAEFTELSRGATDHKDAIVGTISKILTAVFTVGIVLSVMYDRSAVVARIPEGWLGWPILNMFCWSSDVVGGITVPCWVIISSRVAISFAKIKI